MPTTNEMTPSTQPCSPESVEWEAAFGVEAWGFNNLHRTFHSIPKNIMEWRIVNGVLDYIILWDNCDFWRELISDGYSVYCKNGGEHELMARGLYRLGFEEESVLSQLPALSAHERLELRLDFPREFWPQKWLEEEQSG